MCVHQKKKKKIPLNVYYGVISTCKDLHIFISINSPDFTARNLYPENSMNVKLNPTGFNCVCAGS